LNRPNVGLVLLEKFSWIYEITKLCTGIDIIALSDLWVSRSYLTKRAIVLILTLKFLHNTSSIKAIIRCKF